MYLQTSYVCLSFKLVSEMSVITYEFIICCMFCKMSNKTDKVMLIRYLHVYFIFLENLISSFYTSLRQTRNKVGQSLNFQTNAKYQNILERIQSTSIYGINYSTKNVFYVYHIAENIIPQRFVLKRNAFEIYKEHVCLVVRWLRGQSIECTAESNIPYCQNNRMKPLILCVVKISI